MASFYSDGSPTGKRKASASFTVHEDQENETQGDGSTDRGACHKDTDKRKDDTISGSRAPLEESTMGNQSQRQRGSHAVSYKKQKFDHSLCTNNHENGHPHVEELLSKLAEQQQVIEKQQHALIGEPTGPAIKLQLSSDSGTDASGQDTDSSHSAVYSNQGTTNDTHAEMAELLRLKQELIAAKTKIARMDQELSQTRIAKHTMDQILGPSSEAESNANGEIAELPGKIEPDSVPPSSQALTGRPNSWDMLDGPASRTQLGRGGTWVMVDDAQSDSSEALSAGGLHRGKGIWSNSSKPSLHLGLTAPTGQQYVEANTFAQDSARGTWFGRGAPQPQPVHSLPPRVFSGPAMRTMGGDNGFVNGPSQFNVPQPLHRPGTQNGRASTGFNHRSTTWAPYSGNINSAEHIMGGQHSNGYQPTGSYHIPLPYQPRPIGTPLSPTAAEFQSGNPGSNPWNPQVSHAAFGAHPADFYMTQVPTTQVQTYVSPIEPLNYRRLLERSVNCNWKYIVDKIVCNNDQQASIFLQQKLKVGTVEQKYEIVDAIVAQAYPLMVNRFGNFLVQRCFEHGTPEQVVGIANAIRGNTLNLSMDAFGCHVVQKAFDSVPEEYKAVMVHELLRRIPETVVHRYACHVWQKLFELRWADSPPQIMKYVNEALLGMWHEVALGETGSLVVQNIFENCLEEDKRPCINEVLASIDLISHGQFGNWCIQHICEHGLPADRSRAIDHVIRNAAEYSMDQFASKVVEKCLKIGGPEFLERYLDRVCEGRADRPRIPLIDIASDQYGNYLVQYILTHSNPQHREIVASHIRKHMVSLRGSKFGSRVGMLCCNPAFATRPGPGAGPPVGRYGNQNNRFGGAYR
ncbi:hypothetical protein FGG08_003697 [Glutinoglossum americanum]|uniref:PUM-HD domain-containing protein n=1 Tax=Glutinoglossum americanum TaxID=1670608 RepID=A0A9P8I959_9PEZI|nr:hypothetical protein FGG08_003697 [Glutinoglossum americanum]